MSSDSIELPGGWTVRLVYKGDETRVLASHEEHGLVHQRRHFPGFTYSDWTFKHVGKTSDWDTLDDALDAMDDSVWIPACRVADAIREVISDE